MKTVRMTPEQLTKKLTQTNLPGSEVPGNTVDWKALDQTVNANKSGWVRIATALPGELEFGGYGRNSKGEALSIMDQFRAIPAWERELATVYGQPVRITHVYWDATSAWTRDNQEPPFRPAWELMNIHMLEERLYDGAAAWEQSRLSRDLMEPLVFVHNMTRIGKQVWSQNDRVASTRNMGDFFQTAAKSATNEDYSRATSTRIRSKRAPKNQCGFYVGGGFPVGYTLKGITFAEDGSFTAPTYPRTDSFGVVQYGKIMEPKKGWAETIRKVYKLLVEENGTLGDAGKLLVADGWINEDVRHLKGGRVRYALTNPILAGYLTHNDSAKEDEAERKKKNNRYRDYKLRLERVQKDANGNPVQGVEPVLTMDEYLALQVAISGRTFQRKAPVEVLLRKLVKCGRCGRTASRGTASHAENGIYGCNGLQTKQCKGISIKLDLLDAYVVDELKKMMSEAMLDETHANQLTNYEALLEGSNPEALRIEQLRQELNEVVQLIKPDQSAVLRDVYTKRAEKLAEEIEQLTASAPKLPVAPAIRTVVTTPELNWDAHSFEQQVQILKSAIEGVYVLPVGRGNARVMNDAVKLRKMMESRIVIHWRGHEKPEAVVGLEVQ